MHILARDVSAVMSQGKEDCTVTVVEECVSKPVEPFCGDAITNQPWEECDGASSAPEGYRCNVCKLVKIDEPKKENAKTNKPTYRPMLPPTGAGNGMWRFVDIKQLMKDRQKQATTSYNIFTILQVIIMYIISAKLIDKC